MANQYIQVVNNIIQFDNVTYGVSQDQEGGSPVVKIYKLSDGVTSVKIYGLIIYYLIPVAQVTITAAPFGNGMKVTIT